MTRNICVSAFICGSHIAIVVPSEFDSIKVGPPSRPSTDTLSRQPSASIIGILYSSSCADESAKRVFVFDDRRIQIEKESIQEDGLPGQARQRHFCEHL